MPGLQVLAICANARTTAPWLQTHYVNSPPPLDVLVIHPDPFGGNYACVTNSTEEYRYYDYSFAAVDDYPGQGNRGWRHWLEFLRPACVIEKPVIFPVERPSSRYHFRSAPRWRRGRWKAKS